MVFVMMNDGRMMMDGVIFLDKFKKFEIFILKE